MPYPLLVAMLIPSLDLDRIEKGEPDPMVPAPKEGSGRLPCMVYSQGMGDALASRGMIATYDLNTLNGRKHKNLALEILPSGERRYTVELGTSVDLFHVLSTSSLADAVHEYDALFGIREGVGVVS